MTHANLLEELRIVVERNSDGDWIPTPVGTQCYMAGSVAA